MIKCNLMKGCPNPSAFSINILCDEILQTFIGRETERNPHADPDFFACETNICDSWSFPTVIFSILFIYWSICGISYGRVAYSFWPRDELFCTNSATFEWNVKCEMLLRPSIENHDISTSFRQNSYIFSIHHTHTHTPHKRTTLIPIKIYFWIVYSMLHTCVQLSHVW